MIKLELDPYDSLYQTKLIGLNKYKKDSEEAKYGALTFNVTANVNIDENQNMLDFSRFVAIDISNKIHIEKA